MMMWDWLTVHYTGMVILQVVLNMRAQDLCYG